jgi:hypothetical protein
MKLPTLPLSLALVFVCLFSAGAQTRRQSATPRQPSLQPSAAGKTAVVIDENLSLLRTRPGLLADPILRIRRGRRVQIMGTAEADGVRFYKISAPPKNFGWLQSDAVFGRFRSDDERLARLVQAAEGFDQIELARTFLKIYPSSRFRAPILLLYGDLLENAAAKLTRDARTRLNRRVILASGAPAHSYYLSFRMLDRYRRLGVTFLFNSSTRTFHYNGASWSEIVRKHASPIEVDEAQKRLESLKEKLARRSPD